MAGAVGLLLVDAAYSARYLPPPRAVSRPVPFSEEMPRKYTLRLDAVLSVVASTGDGLWIPLPSDQDRPSRENCRVG